MPNQRFKQRVMATAIGCLIAGASMLSIEHAIAAQTMEVYVDQDTKQIFSEPGPNRVKMGAFKQVTDANGAETAPVSAAGTGVSFAELEERLEEQKQLFESKLDQALARKDPATGRKKGWYETMNMRGYIQLRQNPIIGGDKTMPGRTTSIRHPADRSIGNDTNFLIRRARLIFFGDVGERLSYYIQPDLASSAGDTGGLAQLRDLYGDVYITKDRVHRIRVGQSKIPYSFENLQSSQNRIALDRNDALNSCCRDERDLGAFYYYTPPEMQEMFKYLVASGLKGSGNYGIFALGVYNGTGANRAENNDNMHVVSRFTYPWKFENGQIFEFGIQGISGTFRPPTSNANLVPAQFRSSGFKDQRVGVHAVLYPQPFGIQAEWNWGRGPRLNDTATLIEEKALNGGYVQFMYKADNVMFLNENTGTWIPFVKWQYFDGGQKFETNAPRNNVNDWEVGFEWEPTKELEFVAYYSRVNRTNVNTAPFEKYKSDLLRMQLQYNF